MCLRLHLPVSGHPRRWQTSGHAHCVWSLEAYRTSSSNHKNSLHLGLGTNPGLCTELRAQACLGLPGEAPSHNCQVITSLAAPGARELGGPGQRGSSYPGLCPAAEPVRVGRRHRPCPLLGPQRGRLRSAAALLASPRVLQRPHSSRRGRSPSTSSRLWSPPGSAFTSMVSSSRILPSCKVSGNSELVIYDCRTNDPKTRQFKTISLYYCVVPVGQGFGSSLV